MMYRIAAVILAAWSALISLSACAEQADPAKPRNIVFILTDDQRFDALGIVNPELRTPAMDALARDGVHFKNTFVATSLCSPSRASILTGKYTKRHGVVDNLARNIAPGTIFFPQYLQQAGFQTAFIGKWHMGRKSDVEQPGFDHWVSFAGQGKYLPGEGVTLNIDGTRVPQRGYITDELTDYAVNWLRKVDRSKPFFLYLSHKAVHDNFTPAERHKDIYKDTPIAMPDPEQVVEGQPLWVQNQRNSYIGARFPYHSHTDVTEIRRKYRSALAAVDDSLARVRRVLKEEGFAENTIIVFMGDNGFMFGEHGLIDKRNAYEESMRVPLIVGGDVELPKNTAVDDMIMNIDIAPTILDMAGLPEKAAEADMDGDSFYGYLKGEAPEDWRSEVYYQYFWEWVFPYTPTTFAVRTDQYKLIQYHGIWDIDELYDLQADPKETINLIERPEHKERVRAMRKQIFQFAQEKGGADVPFTQKQGPGLHFRSIKGKKIGAFPSSFFRDANAPDREDYKD